MTDDLDVRISTADEFPQRTALIAGAFLNDLEDDELELFRLLDEPDRTHVVEDAGHLVATGVVRTRAMSVPGAMIPVGHVTGVAVASTHRRRGLLSRIMTSQLEHIRDRGTEPVAALWASEGAIYGRFGYGAAASYVAYEIPTRETSLPGTTPPGRLRQVVPSDVVDQLAELYERVRPSRPGWSERPGRYWEFRTADPKGRRHGMSARRGLLYEDDGRVEGYALWRVKAGWNNTGPNGEVAVAEVVAASPDAYTALWRFLLSIDLTRTVKYQFAAVDEALPFLVTNPAGLRGSIDPSLWIRIVDVPAALTARRYATAVDVVLEVSDALLTDNAGRWHLVGDRSSAKCEPTDAEPDLTLDVRELGAVYLGGTSLTALAAAGLVTELRPGAVTSASTAFGWHRAPSAVEIF